MCASHVCASHVCASHVYMCTYVFTCMHHICDNMTCIYLFVYLFVCLRVMTSHEYEVYVHATCLFVSLIVCLFT